MTEIFALLQPIQNSVSKTTSRQLSRIIVAMIAMTGRVTMLGLSRWTEKGGTFGRSGQRFFYTAIPWAQGPLRRSPTPAYVAEVHVANAVKRQSPKGAVLVNLVPTKTLLETRS